MSTAAARHILVATEEACNDLKAKIENGADFAELANAHSECPSGKQGGDLGRFSPGQMVREFDEVVFGAEVGKVPGPVRTQFGYRARRLTHCMCVTSICRRSAAVALCRHSL